MTKEEIRKLFLEKRKALNYETFSHLNAALIRNTKAYFNFNAKVIHLFLSIEKHREPDTFLLKSQIDLDNTNVSWVLSKSNFSNSSLAHFKWNSETLIEENAYGIPEPLNGEKVQEKELDIVFVPLLAASKKGYRVGYGKGFYDRFLSQCRKDCLKIGLSIFEPIEEIADINAFDIALDFIVSPEQVFRIEKE